MMCSAYKLNNQGNNIQPWRTPFPILNQSVVPCQVLTVASWPAYRFLKRQERWSGIPISFRMFHSLLWSTQSKALTYIWFIPPVYFQREIVKSYSYSMFNILRNFHIFQKWLFHFASLLVKFESSNFSYCSPLHIVICHFSLGHLNKYEIV